MSLENSLPGPQSEAVAKNSLFDFEFDYDLSCKSIRDVLLKILNDLSSQKQLHGWDEKLYTTPLKALRTASRELLGRDYGTYSCDIVLTEGAAEEVVTVKGVNYKRPHIQEVAEDIGGHIFFSKTPLQGLAAHLSEAQAHNPMIDPSSDDLRNAQVLDFAQGRIIYTKDQNLESHRAALLILHAFCLRLQGEADTFIRQFIGRHLNLRPAFKVPDYFQATSPLVEINSFQMSYKRVTLSCHIPYLMLSKDISSLDQNNSFDRLALGAFAPKRHAGVDEQMQLAKSSSSVLLTLALPEESSKGEEETILLKNPQALWTVLVINGSSQNTMTSDFLQHLTPIAQYLRGITASLSVQQIHAEIIYEALKRHVAIAPDDSLFDDEHFTKSKLYHWAIKMCQELHESIASSLKFVSRLQESQTNKLCQEAHPHEKLGIGYWTRRLEEQIFELGQLADRVNVLRAKIYESRDALHGVTAVLEARIALQQGDRIKTLTYLATAYLPLSAVASIYGMSVLPSSATFPSFFAVLIIFLLVTLLFGINLPKILPPLKTNFNFSGISLASIPFSVPKPLKRYIQSYVDALTPILTPELPDETESPEAESSQAASPQAFGLRRSVIAFTRSFIVPEMSLPLQLYHAFYMRHSQFVSFRWSPVLMVAHLFRLAFLPVWCVLFTVILCFLVFLDLCSASLSLLLFKN